MRRIAIVGTAGAGKSVLAGRLAPALGAEIVELDQLFWGPDWTPVLPELFRHRVEAATSADRWIVSGNYAQVRDIVWRRADTVVWLDYALPLSLRRLAARTIRRVVSGEDLWGTGNRETWRALFGRDSILLWAARTHQRNAQRLTQSLDEQRFAHLQTLRFKSPRELRRWLAAQASADRPTTGASADEARYGAMAGR
ncbi:MAG: adenylate kinase [Rhodospirillales bacterium]|nr:adenylate kinase [Rhodospirillales bacterium]